MMKKLVLFLTLAITVSLFQSCEKEPLGPGEEATAPQLPPKESFVMPFTGFESVDTPGITNDNLEFREPTFKNWFHAAANLVVWNTAIGLNMAVPVAAFVEAFNHNPVFQGGGVFLWAYSVDVAGQTYIIALTGQFINNNQDVQWIMKMSQIGGFSDFEWYSGVISADGSSGQWIINHQPNNPEEYLQIDYEREDNSTDGFIRYTNVNPSSPGMGDYIEYREGQAGDFNRAYDVFRTNNDDLLEIQWNAPSNEGRVKHFTRFNDDEWHCWDTERMDTDC